ncbi:MAG: hypothetical protein AB7F98_09735 [Novosphingobium sp.]
MNNRRLLWSLTVVFTAAAYSCFSIMDSKLAPDYSATEDVLFYGGYALCALSLLLFILGLRAPK